MKEILRVRCPMCKMMPTLEFFRTGVGELRIYLQKIGGRYPKSSKGICIYEDITGKNVKLVNELWALIDEKMAKIQELRKGKP